MRVGKGFFRVKLVFDQIGQHEVKLVINGQERSIATVDVLENCNKYIKYLDRYGRYRFFPFSGNFTTELTKEKIGEISKNTYDLENAESSTDNIGYNVSKSVTLAARVSEEQMRVLEDLYLSPRVYLFEKKKWIRVEIENNEQIKTLRNFRTLKLTVKLPQNYAITSI